MALDAAARNARARFQSGLLAWLRQPGDGSGLREMIAVLRDMSATDASRRVLWSSAEAFLASLLDGTLPADQATRAICRRIERRLSAAQASDGDDEALSGALFAYVSRQSASSDAEQPALRLAGLPQALGDSLARTAELLPLLAGALPPRHGPAALAAWALAARELDAAWQGFVLGRRDDCRRQATALVAAALQLNTAPSLRLAEELADACAQAEDPAVRNAPQMRAAVAAALEIAGDRDAPNHPHFDRRASGVARRLVEATAAARPASRPTGDSGGEPVSDIVEKIPTLR